MKISLLILFITLLGILFLSAISSKPNLPNIPSYNPHKTNQIKIANKDANGYYVNASINGGPVNKFRIDTGSVGIVVSEDQIGTNTYNIDKEEEGEKGEKGNVTYTSSGVSLDGMWKDAVVVFTDTIGPDNKPLYSIVKVLAVNKRTVLPNRVNRPHNTSDVINPRVFMMGVGFGRPTPSVKSYPNITNNPFLNIQNINNKEYIKGYEINNTGFYLGARPISKYAEDGYGIQKLNRNGTDWQTPTGEIKIGNNGSRDTTVLVDTGLANMMIGIPELDKPVELPNGSQITVVLPSFNKYSFRVGDGGNLTPSKVTLIRPRIGENTLNTGINVLNGFNYFFDYDNGYVGFAPILT